MKMNNKGKANNILMWNKNIKPRAPLERKRKKMGEKKEESKGQGEEREEKERKEGEREGRRVGRKVWLWYRLSSFSTCVFRSLHSNKLRNRTSSSLIGSSILS